MKRVYEPQLWRLPFQHVDTWKKYATTIFAKTTAYVNSIEIGDIHCEWSLININTNWYRNYETKLIPVGCMHQKLTKTKMYYVLQILSCSKSSSIPRLMNESIGISYQKAKAFRFLIFHNLNVPLYSCHTTMCFIYVNCHLKQKRKQETR